MNRQTINVGKKDVKRTTRQVLALFYRGCNLVLYQSTANQSTFSSTKVRIFLVKERNNQKLSLSKQYQNPSFLYILVNSFSFVFRKRRNGYD